MAPMKYEEQLKDKLEQRTIQPSTDAWQKLNDKLNANQSKKNNKGFWYLGIAASIVGVLLITNMFFNNDNANIIEPTIVDVDTTNSKPIGTEEEDVTAKDEEALVDDTEVIASDNDTKEEQKTQPIKKSGLKENIKKEQLKLIPNKKEETVIASNVKEDKEEATKKLSFEEQKAKDVVAQIQNMQKTKEVTDADIDALLNAAQREIAFKRLYNESTKTIDANALLLSVEDDIEQESFRARVFEMLKAGYNEVKTVVADRNN